MPQPPSLNPANSGIGAKWDGHYSRLPEINGMAKIIPQNVVLYSLKSVYIILNIATMKNTVYCVEKIVEKILKKKEAKKVFCQARNIY